MGLEEIGLVVGVALLWGWLSIDPAVNGEDKVGGRFLFFFEDETELSLPGCGGCLRGFREMEGEFGEATGFGKVLAESREPFLEKFLIFVHGGSLEIRVGSFKCW